MTYTTMMILREGTSLLIYRSFVPRVAEGDARPRRVAKSRANSMYSRSSSERPGWGAGRTRRLFQRVIGHAAAEAARVGVVTPLRVVTMRTLLHHCQGCQVYAKLAFAGAESAVICRYAPARPRVRI